MAPIEQGSPQARLQQEAKVRSCLEATADEVVDLLMAKRADYGTANIAITGLYGVAVRLQDKVARLLNLLASGQEPNHESVEDTFRDIVGYGLIGLRSELWGIERRRTDDKLG